MKKLITSSGILWSCLIAMVMMLGAQNARAEYVKLTCLDARNAYNGDDEHGEKLVDMKDGINDRDDTKWGTWFDPTAFHEDWPLEDVAYIVIKAKRPVVPEWYFLVTGNDTGKNTGRNWASWKIFGGNFESDDLAVRDVENYTGWTLLEDRTNGQLPGASFAVKDYNFNNADGVTAYQYYWIEITDCVEGGETYLQMEEWGLGSHDDFEYFLAHPETETDEPLLYEVVEGTRNNGDNEGLPKLFDGKSGTKWGNSFKNRSDENDLNNGAYFIVKASRYVCPTYYCLTTANDTGNNPGRNWKKWRIYGITSSTAPARDAAGWKLLDSKADIGPDQLAAANYTDCYFSMSEENTTEYRYFKVEIDECVSASTYMQMAEFTFGDVYTLSILRSAILDPIAFDPDVFAQKVLVDSLGTLVDAINASTDATEIMALGEQAAEQKELVNTSAKQYAELTTARNQAILQLGDNNVADAALAYVQGWVNDTEAIAPNEDYPCGNFAHIKATQAITGEEAVAEAKRFLVYLLANAKSIDDPIYTTYTRLSGSGGFSGEGDEMLYDGIPRDIYEYNPETDKDERTVKGTKWCTNTLPAWTVFKTDDAIKPTYYGLVTGNDTFTNPGRNWKTWKIWGANFDSDEEATRDADGWVLIDEKNNIGKDILHTENEFESYIYLSEGCSVAYKYFKIEVTEAASGNLIQMNEFTFYNQGNFVDYRQDFIDEFADYDADGRPAYPGYIEEFKTKYEELCNAASAPDLMSLKNETQALKDQIESSVARYEEYEEVYEELVATGPASEILEPWFNGYTSDNEGPGSMYLRGTHDYIVEGHVLNNEELGQLGKPEDLDPGRYPASGEIGYIKNMIDAANEGRYILIGGNTDDQWADGFYGNLIDGIALNDTIFVTNESGEIEVDDKGNPKVDKVYRATKWGGNAKGAGGTFEDTYVIFRTAEATNPYFYTLTTGNDTGKYPSRNWGTWYIYGANFNGDGDATKDAADWVLIDSKENTGQDRLHAVNCQPSYFGFSSETTQKYVYYKVVVTNAYSGSQIQMNELHFGTEDEFDEIKDEYATKARDFNYDVVAYQALIDEYALKIDSIENCINMEVLFRLNAAIETLKPKIKASAAVYANYQAAVDAAKAYLQENNLTDSEAKTVFVNYLNTNADPDDEGLYPNGTALYILEQHELPDSVIVAEVEFLESLKGAAVAQGYAKGMDVSSLIVNRTFAKASATLKDDKGNDVGREAEGWDGYIFRTATDSIGTVYAAEFCNYLAKFNVSQTLTGLQNGYYKVTLNAAYRSNGDLLAFNYAPMAYANDVQTFIPVIREDAVADSLDSWQGYAADRKITYQNEYGESEVVWGMWGCEGAANAFRQEHYPITLVAQVTDGTLTIGVKNQGTKGNEWTAVSNFGLWYLGDNATDEVVTDALAEVAEYNAARINTLLDRMEDVYGGSYSNNPGFSADQRNALDTNSGVETYAAEKTIGETMQAIYEIKPAYAALCEAANKVYDKWELAENDLYDAMEDEVNIVRANLEAGAYADSETALAAKADLYAHWPGYLQPQIDSEGSPVVENMELEQTNFEYAIQTTGNKPYVELYKLYEPLDKKEIVLAFDYTADQDIENGYFYYMTPALKTKPTSAIPTLAAAQNWTTVYYNVQEGIDALQFGSATDHGIRWYVSYSGTSDSPLAALKLQARNFRFMTVAQVKAEGGKLLNGLKGDINGDLTIDVADVQKILILVADGSNDPAADVNGDGKVDVADAQTILIMIADQQ